VNGWEEQVSVRGAGRSHLRAKVENRGVYPSRVSLGRGSSLGTRLAVETARLVKEWVSCRTDAGRVCSFFDGYGRRKPSIIIKGGDSSQIQRMN